MVEQLVRALYPHAEEGLPDAYLVSAFRHLFDWNEAIVQPLEPWLSPVGESFYDEVLRTIERLAPGLDARRLLTPGLGATLAEIVLPMKGGHEAEVLERLASAFGQPGFDAVRFVSAFDAFRERRYGHFERPPATQDDWDGPGATRATPVNAPDWQNTWETPCRRREILQEWSDTTPTDGVHVVAVAGHCPGALDELTRQSLASTWAPPDAGAGEAE